MIESIGIIEIHTKKEDVKKNKSFFQSFFSKKEKKTSTKNTNKKVVNFDGEEKEVLITNTVDAETKNKKIIKDLQKSIYLYCLFLHLMKKEKGYYTNNSTKELLIFRIIENGKYEVFKTLIKDNEESDIELVDDFFNGESVYKIEEDYISIGKEYLEGNNNILILLLLIIILTVAYYFLVIDEKKSELPPPPPEPKAVKILKIDEDKMKKALSLIMIKKLREMVINIHENELFNKRKRRILYFGQKQFAKIQPVKAVLSSQNTYFYPQKKLKYGGMKQSYFKIYDQRYMGKNFLFHKNSVYRKEETDENKIYYKNYRKNKVKILSRECLIDVMAFSPENTVAFGRNDDEVKFKFSKMSPSLFLKKAENILRRCPAYLSSTKVEKGNFDGFITLYNIKKEEG